MLSVRESRLDKFRRTVLHEAKVALNLSRRRWQISCVQPGCHTRHTAQKVFSVFGIATRRRICQRGDICLCSQARNVIATLFALHVLAPFDTLLTPFALHLFQGKDRGKKRGECVLHDLATAFRHTPIGVSIACQKKRRREIFFLGGAGLSSLAASTQHVVQRC